MYVSIGHIPQWIEIDRTDQANPVLLFLHGGPGGSSRPAAAAWKPWANAFTLAHWDQRGAGRTFARNGEAGCGPLTIARLVEDGIEVAEFLHRNLHKPKLLLVGHSFGSVLAVHMLRQRPKLFAAYVGAGQLVNKRANEEIIHARLLARARATRDDEALLALSALTAPLHASPEKVTVLRQWADRLADGNGDEVQMHPSPPSAGFTAQDRDQLARGRAFSRAQLFDEIAALDLAALGLDFAVPMFFFHGTHDQQAAIELAEQYCADITAPAKGFVRFEGCHHFVAMNRPELFLHELLARVRPVL